QRVELLPQARKNTVIWELAELGGAALEVDEVWAAPEAEVGVVGLAGAVHAAAHDGDGEGVVFGVPRHFLHLLCQVDEGLVLDPRAAGAGDNVEGREAVGDDRADP